MKRFVIAGLFLCLAGCAGRSGGGAASAGSEGGDSGGEASCAQEIALSCPAGQEDGCLSAQTTNHVCIAEGSEGVVPCAQELALQCDNGGTDACLIDPAPAANHICVYR